MFEKKTIKLKQCSPEKVALYMKNLLKMKGFKPLNSGSYATVYGAKGHDKVYKIGRVADNERGYLKYLRALHKMRKHNPFTPKIYSWWTFTDGRNTSNNVFVITMERLVEFDSDDAYEVSDMLEGIIRSKRDNKSNTGAERLGVEIKMPAKLNRVVTIIADLLDNTDARSDIHTGNIMLRGNQVVITDPIH